MGSDEYYLVKTAFGYVSIHAPTWGATILIISHLYYLMFQSTLPHGERLIFSRIIKIPNSFNPRSHMGSDIFPNENLSYMNVSIHAPTWGATDSPIRISASWKCFNPRSHMGSDLFYRFCPIIIYSFNPRSHMGSDEIWREAEIKYSVSIHAPTWGATVN